MYLNNVCQQLSLSDAFVSNSAQQGGAVAILSPALNSGRYILSVKSFLDVDSILRLPCGVSSAMANATFTGNAADLSGGAVYAVSTPLVRHSSTHTPVKHQCCAVYAYVMQPSCSMLRQSWTAHLRCLLWHQAV